MSRQNKQRRKAIVAKEITSLHKQGKQGKRTEKRHNKKFKNSRAYEED